MQEIGSDLPLLTRRDFWRVGAVSITGGTLLPMAGRLNAAATSRVEPRGGAECIVFLNLVGGPSQMDTFDVKEYKFTPQDLDIQTLKLGYRWPFGLLPKTAGVLEDVVVARSMAAWETLHNLAQYYLQVGHPFTAARAKELPSMGSVIAYETLDKTKESDFLPPYISMNFPAGAVNGTLIREGFLDSGTAPLTMDMRKGGSMPFLLNEDYRPRFHRRLDFLRSFDSSRQLTGTGVSKLFHEWDAFSRGAEKMIRSPQMSTILKLNDDDRKRYGSTPFGDGCQIARNMLAAGAGARYILVNQGGWDHHGDIYGKSDGARMEDPRMRGGLYTNCAEFDPAFAALIEDLKTLKAKDGSPLLDKTLVVATGEFGRTPGNLTDIKGRDHWPDVRAGLFAGAGVKGGRVIGATDEQGGKITRFEWHKNRPIYPEDVTATIYSVLGIDWTKRIEKTPSGRAFEYVEPMSGTTHIGSTEIKELFG
ncbi:MAG: DUF1501 domain-containing protein [Bryobacteraceae bacterium]